ncbi:MAG: hypothetical protein LIO54_03645 [Oscillospiraceae bacterium]|nr:hypothetical protein [Oscillospiraceae bacterium]
MSAAANGFSVDVVGAEKLERIGALLSNIPRGLDRALRAAMVRTTSRVRTQSTAAIRETYDIAAGDVRAAENVRVRYRYGSGVTATVTFAGKKIPLWRYASSGHKPVSPNGSVWVNAMIEGHWRRVHPGLPGYGRQMKSAAVEHYDNVFTAQMKSGHIGLFERTGGMTASGSDEIHEIMGSSVAQMLANRDVSAHLAEDAAAKFNERLDHEVSRLLHGWGARSA